MAHVPNYPLEAVDPSNNFSGYSFAIHDDCSSTIDYIGVPDPCDAKG